MTRARPGTVMVEAIIAMTAGIVVLSAAVVLFRAQARAAAQLRETLLAADAERSAAAVLSAELRHAMPQDLTGLQPAMLRLRAFRGYALPCGGSDPRLLVRYRGIRDPDVRKDSVLVMMPGAERVVALSASTAAPGACGAMAGERVFRWDAAMSADSALVLLVFETGEYHLANAALRYRSGSASRQPLTPELFRTPGSYFEPARAGDVLIGFRLHLLRAPRGSLPLPAAPTTMFLPLAGPVMVAPGGSGQAP
jgi:hypothetical protein